MSSFTALLLAYILGGLTFIPLVIALFFLHAYLTFPEVFLDPPERPLQRYGDDGVFKTDDEKLVRRLANSVDVAAGYFLVTREFVPGGVNGKPPERASPAGNSPPSQNSSPSVYQSMYRTLFDRKSSLGTADSGNGQKARGRRPMNEFFVVLRHGHLMLYDDEQQAEVRHVVSLGLYNVSIYGGGEVIPEGELYIRRNAICLSRRTSPVDTSLDESAGLPFFLFSENCSNKEDFYLALVKHQDKSPDDPTVPPKPLRYRQKDVISLVQRLHSSEDQLQMNWVNGLLGRLFLSVYRTPEVEQFFRSRIVKKISRVAKPNFLSDIELRRIYVGDSVPCITNPRLKEMTADGDFCCEFDISYSGNFRLEIATKATMNLGARFKPREVNLLLAVLLKRLDGHGVIRIKPPPSNRLWFSFERIPKMELLIEPIVGSRQMAWGPILRIIESRIREVIEESVVLPYYDDIPFTDTIEQKFRGGIWQMHKSAPPRVAADSEKDLMDIEVNGGIAEIATDEPLLSISGQQKSQSTPYLPATHSTTVDEDKAASIMGLVEADDALRNDSRSPSVKSKDSSERKSKAIRTHPFSSITPTPPAPSVGTDAINVTAIRERVDPTEINNASFAISSIRSRASSSPQTPSPISLGHPRLDSFNGKSQPDSNGATENDADYSMSLAEQDHDSTLLSPGSFSGGSAQAFGSNYSQPNFLGPGSRSSTTSSTRGPLESVAALGTAAAAVKKWYVTRKNTNPPTTSETTQPSTHSLPPATIPPPPMQSKKAAPINMPRRKTLPPPIIPNRKSRQSIPPLPPRDSSNGGEGFGEMLVVAAPDSEPTTPRTEENKAGSFDEQAATSFDSTSSSSRRETRDGSSSSWERGAIRGRTTEESESWYPAEEAEMRARVPWEPDEL